MEATRETRSKCLKCERYAHVPSVPLRLGICYPTERIDLARYLSDRLLQIHHSPLTWTSLKVLVVPHFLLLPLPWKEWLEF